MTSLQSVEHFYLDSCLAPIASYLALPNLTDLFINRPGELWIETIGSPPRRVEAPDLTSSVLNRLARQIAAVSAQGISRENPLLSASLPTGERVQIVLPPATRGDIAFAFRKHVMTDLGLDDYHAAGAFDASVIGRKTQEMYAEENGAPIESGLDVVRRAVRTKRNILISGGTSSGKTTFLNALLREAAPHERLIAIEDTPELRLVHDNAVGLITPRGVMGETHVTAEDLLIASLRMRPDRILLGEIRGKEAMTFLRAINTGHPGSMATIHADSPARAIDQLAILVMQQGTKMSWEDVTTYVKRSIGLVVHLTYDMGVRRIDEIAFIS